MTMPVIDWRVDCFRRAFLRPTPQWYALMLVPAAATRLGQKYIGRREQISDAMIAQHLAGVISLAAPAAVTGRAQLLPLDIDAGGIDAINALLAEATQRKLWAFGQYCRRDGVAEADQRGYVWLPFDMLADAQRLQALGAQLIAALGRPGWKIETRAFHAATRLPLARHTHTGRFGDLVLADRQIAIDQDPAGALTELHDVYRENRSTALPDLPPPSPRSDSCTAAIQWHGAGITINGYNQAHNVAHLLRFYGARPTRRRGLYFCPFHGDEHASLSVYTQRGQQYCRCFSAHSDCPLAKHVHNDAFNVYCIGESIDTKAALRRLNRRE
jgi:hypothetical protein